MDCLEAQALLSAQCDGEALSAEELHAARDHCADCPDCAAFDAGLNWLGVTPAPTAPKDLVDRVMGAVTIVATERAESELLETERLEAEREEAAALEAGRPQEPEPQPSWVRLPAAWLGEVPTGWFERVPAPARWAGIGAVATVAATALIAFVLLSGQSGPGTASRDAATSQASPSTATAPDLTFGEAGTDSGSVGGRTGAPAAPSRAPDYILFRGVVFSPGALLNDSSSATPTIGTVATAFASTGGPQQANVFRSPLSDGSIVVQGPDGVRVYAPVVRLLSSVRYQLTSGSTIDRFGVWPTLPTRFPVPAGTDGNPSFVTAGVDALNVNVYAASGRPVNEGFAIAPGTTSDPAGGNPNWTWWAPMGNQSQ